MSLGLTPHGTISKKKRIFWEGQFFAVIRSFKDGITFFNLKKSLWVFLTSYLGKIAKKIKLKITSKNIIILYWNFKFES